MVSPFIGAVIAALMTAAAPPQKTPVIAWYTQIGAWRIQKDSVSGSSFLFHDAKIDGMQSGEATANVRLNKGFKGLREFDARLSLGPAPSVAGMLAQDKKITYYFLLKNGGTEDSLLTAFRRTGMNATRIISMPIRLQDTVMLRLSVANDSLRMIVGKTIASMKKPVDFPKVPYIGFECPKGSVKVFEVTVVSDDGEMKDAFGRAALVNLHLEKMFPLSR